MQAQDFQRSTLTERGCWSLRVMRVQGFFGCVDFGVGVITVAKEYLAPGWVLHPAIEAPDDKTVPRRNAIALSAELVTGRRYLPSQCASTARRKLTNRLNIINKSRQ